MIKTFKDDKYIYFLMAYESAKKSPNGYVKIGDDNNFKGAWHYERRFQISVYNDKLLLTETRSSEHCADFSRVVEILYPLRKKPDIIPYINEAGENCFSHWTH